MFQEKSEFAPPEGGWSWLIVVAIAMNKMAFWGALPCFGIVFADVLGTRPGQEGASIASIISAFNIAVDITCMGCPAFFKRFSYRQVGTSGGLLYLAGSLAAAFSVTVAHMVMSFGVLQGLGFGLMVSSSLASFNHHFRRRRTVAMASALCATGAGALGLPLAAQTLQVEVGKRAAKLAFTALSAAAAASQLFLLSPPAPIVQATVCSGYVAGKKTSDIRAEDGSEDRAKYHFGAHIPETEYNNAKSTERGRGWMARARAGVRRAWRLTGLEARVVRRPLVVLVGMGVALVHVLESNFFAMLPLHLRALFDEVGVAQVVTASTAGDFAGRVLLALGGRWLCRRNRAVFALAAFVAAVSVFALSLVWTWGALLTLAALLGVSKGAIYVTLFLTMAEIVEPAHYTSAATVHFVFQMLFALSVSPAIGAVRDATGSFRVCFRMVAGLLVLTPLLWTLDAVLRGRAGARGQSRGTTAAGPTEIEAPGGRLSPLDLKSVSS